MPGTIMLTDHEAVRDWVAARAGIPAIVDVSAQSGTQPMLKLVFGLNAYLDRDRVERLPNSGGVDLVEWDEWFKIFDERKLALVVSKDVPGVRDETHQLVRRFETDA